MILFGVLWFCFRVLWFCFVPIGHRTNGLPLNSVSSNLVPRILSSQERMLLLILLVHKECGGGGGGMLSLVSRKDKDPNNSSSTNKNTTALQLLKKDQRLQQSSTKSTVYPNSCSCDIQAFNFRLNARKSQFSSVSTEQMVVWSKLERGQRDRHLSLRTWTAQSCHWRWRFRAMKA